MTFRSPRMTSGIERVFRPIIPYPDYHGPQLYREIYLHFIHFMDETTGQIISSKLDKNIPGKLYKVAVGDERSLNGEIEYQFPNSDKPVRLIALQQDINGNPLI